MIYRSVLAKELISLGYNIEKTREDGLFEIEGFTRKQIEAFSNRRMKILSLMEEQGLSGTHAAQAVTLHSRERKEEIDRSLCHQRWVERAKEVGLNVQGMVEKSKVKSVGMMKRSRQKWRGGARRSITT